MPTGQLIIRHRNGIDLSVLAVPSDGGATFTTSGTVDGERVLLEDVEFSFTVPTLPAPAPSEHDIREMSPVEIARYLVERLDEERSEWDGER